VNSDPAGLDGISLTVVYSNPSLSDSTVAILAGSQATTGDTATLNLASPLDKTVPGFQAIMSLGIGFSFQSGPGATHGCTTGSGIQFSTVDVNNTRMTSCAGHTDDAASGGLITVGGEGDLTDNPPNPEGSGGFDDELYDIEPFLAQGDTEIQISTVNPSNDDNLFLEVIRITATATAATEICDDGIDNDGDDLIDGNDPDCQISEEPSTTIRGTFAAGPNSSFIFQFPTGDVKVTFDNVVIPFDQDWTTTEKDPATESLRYVGSVVFPPLTGCLPYDLDEDGVVDDPDDRCVLHDALNAIVAGVNTGAPPRSCEDPDRLPGDPCHFTGNVTIEMRHQTSETFQNFTPGMAEDFHDFITGQDNVPDDDILVQYINNPTGVGRTKKNSSFELVRIPAVGAADNIALSNFLFPLNVKRTFKRGLPIVVRLRLAMDPPGAAPPAAIRDAELIATVAKLLPPNPSEVQGPVEFRFINQPNLFRFIQLPKAACGKNWKGLCGEYVYVIDTRKLPAPPAGGFDLYRFNSFGHLVDGRGLPLRSQDFKLIR
jgi:hypothetical protein